MENINNKIKIFCIFLALLFTSSCKNTHENSFDSLFSAFNKWFFIHHPEIFDNFDSYNFYSKNKRGDSDYLNEYLFDLKRFNLELSQIHKKKLTRYNRNKYISLDEKLNSLIFNYHYQDYNRNPSYYLNSINWYFLNLLLSENIYNNDKLLLIDNTLNLLPSYLEKTKKNLLYSNDYLIENGLNKIDLTIDLLENISTYIDISDTLLSDMEDLMLQNNKALLSYKEWLQNQIKKEEKVAKIDITSILNNQLVNLEKKYGHQNILDNLELDIKRLRKQIFDNAYLIYDGKKYEDTLSIVASLIAEDNKKTNINKDYSSRIIDFNNRYQEVLSFLRTSNLMHDLKPLDIEFPHYNIMFDKFDASLIIANPYYGNSPMNLIINPSDDWSLSKTDIDLFIIEEVLSRALYYSNNNKLQINIYNDVNHYAWSKILSEIMIKNGYSIVNQNYQLIHDVTLLHDFCKIYIKYKYYSSEFSKEEASTFLLENTFLNIESSNRIISQIIYDYSKNDLEYYVSYIYMKNLFNKNCVIDNKLSDYLFIEKIFKHGFLPIYNYKSILN